MLTVKRLVLEKKKKKEIGTGGAPGGSVGYVYDFGTGHDLGVLG